MGTPSRGSRQRSEKSLKRSSANSSEKILVLWAVFLLGTLFHTQLALMPLFHGINVAESHTHEYINNLSVVFWFMLIFFMLPMLAMIAAVFRPSSQFYLVHLGLTLVYSLLNLAHLWLDILVTVPPYQIVLMFFLFVVGLVLNVVSYQAMRANLRPHSMP